MMLYDIPHLVFACFEHLGTPTSITPVTMGLINKTYLVCATERTYILQEVSPIFDVGVTEDSFAVSRYLAQAGIDAPLPYQTIDGDLIVQTSNRVFRALTFIRGTASHTISSLAMAESAGKVLGSFHRAMLDFHYEYRSRRRHGGDYGFHKANLIVAMNQHKTHDFFTRVEPIAQDLLAKIEQVTDGLFTTPRHVHGDPKVSNILFDNGNNALCLVDFDTLGNSGWSLEMGDALRSWCNPYPEDILDAHVDLARAEYALKGYGSTMRGLFSAEETSELIKHTQAITLCLAMRYLADVLNENYFAYDKARFNRASEHQWLRACSMHNLYRDFSTKVLPLSQMVQDLLL